MFSPSADICSYIVYKDCWWDRMSNETFAQENNALNSNHNILCPPLCGVYNHHHILVFTHNCNILSHFHSRTHEFTQYAQRQHVTKLPNQFITIYSINSLQTTLVIFSKILQFQTTEIKNMLSPYSAIFYLLYSSKSIFPSELTPDDSCLAKIFDR